MLLQKTGVALKNSDSSTLIKLILLQYIDQTIHPFGMEDSMIKLISNPNCFTSFNVLTLYVCDVFHQENTEQHDTKRFAILVIYESDKEFDDFMVFYCK